MNNIWYRGTPNRSNDASKFRGDIIWFTKDFKYAKSYANAYKGIVVKASIDCKNTFDAGITDDLMCKLFPINYPFKLSPSMLKLMTKLHMSEDEFWKMFSSLENDKSEFYQYKIFTLVRTTQFRDLLISKGYDSVRTVEFGSECLGVFNNNQINLINYDEGIDNLFKKIYNIDENKRGSYMKKINEDVSVDLKKSKLADYLGVDEEEIEEVDENHFNFEDAEYLVCTSDEAYNYASEDIQNTFDDLGLDAFTQGFQNFIIDNCMDLDWFEDLVKEDIEYNVNDNEEYEHLSSEERDELIDKLYDDVDDLVSYISDHYGRDYLNELIQDNPGCIDMNKVIDACIDEDGIAHFISYYDGEEIELGDDLFAYRQN